jgi:hypothetical protein
MHRFHEPTACSSPQPDDFSRQPDNVTVRNYYLYCPLYLIFGSRLNVVSIATCSEMDGPGFELHGGEIFRTYLVRPRGHPASRTVGTGSLAAVKRLERDVDHPTLLASGSSRFKTPHLPRPSVCLTWNGTTSAFTASYFTTISYGP